MQTLGTVHKFLQVVQQYPDILPNLIDSVSDGQIKSKQWLLDEVKKLDIDLGTIFICAGWYGTLANMLFDSGINFIKIRSFDIDDMCYKVAERINKVHVTNNWRFKASTIDIINMQYPTVHDTIRANGTVITLTEMPDTIINTSCEHIKNFKQWYNNIPLGKLIILQNNNYYKIIEHINCVESLIMFEKDSPMTKLLYQGTLKLDEYERFMRIGIK